MFYSQFILAKKGPLGTIWIAAHLERKLKKNQVADTDIGDSVDSILFPDVPIALRLSSHLLLGVVRIYSKKVNYLFHDCSEALLNVKQAFRSTAVDLPPEESTAPYHSITLPETFDLDDFELPDSALLSGNFDDRHVSTREQITLQDTVDGTGYSTSQFGLDERFGDGDASQIGLELDEELLLENNLTLQDAQVLDSDVHQGDGTTDLSKMDTEECQHGHDEYRNDGASMELSELLCNKRGKHVLFSHAENVNGHDDSSHRLIFNIQTPDLNEVFLSDDHIGGPSAADDTDMEYAGADPPFPEFNESANFPFKPDSVLAINDACHKHDSANNVLGVSSTTSVLTELHPPASRTLGVILPGCDAAGSTIIASETSDPKLACISQMLPCSDLVSDSLIPQRSGETIAAPAAGLGLTLKTADTLNGEITCSKENARLISVGNKMMSGVNLDMDRIAVQDITRLSNLDQGRIEDAYSCQTSNFSAFSSDFHLRSCTSESNQTNLISPEFIVQKGDQGMSFREQPSILETAVEDQEMHFSGSSINMQAFGSAIAVDTNLGVHQKSNDMLLGMTSVNNPMDLSSSSISKDVQSGHGNCFSTSEFSEPERMRFALSGNVDLVNDVGQQTTEKEVNESDGSVDRISNVFRQKHYLMYSTPDLQNGISPKISGIPQKKRKNDFIPNDDDLLASILVGRTPAFRIGPTPPLPKPPPSKRPRLTTKVGFPKRKVLLDDTVVLHADTIRQQLINTEDIRRMRKKVPCTRPEIWRIQKSLLKDDIFSETVFTGVSEELNRLLIRIYDLGRTVHSQTNRKHLSEAEHELELSKSLGFVRNNDGREMADQSAVVPKRVYGESQGPSGTPELIDTQNCKNAVSIDAQGRSESPLDQLDPSQNTTSRTELGALGISSNECAVPTDSRIEEKHADICIDPDQNSPHELVEVNNNTLHVGESTPFEDFTSDYAAGDGVINNNIVLGATSNNILLEVDNFSNSRAASITLEDMGVNMIPVPSLDCPLDSVQAIGLVDGRPDTREYHDMKESEDGRLMDGCETAVDEERPTSVVSCREKPTSESERVVSAVGENSCMNIECGLDVESAHMELAPTRESSDFCSAIDDIDTDFLNADDEVEYDEETNNDVPNHEAQSLDTGWSSRTRGVARYLKNMFDQESGHGRKSVAIDHLLTGKTRKEASRMFFETLVLKTKDYIQVEQEKAFDCVNINPRIKLLKSGF